MTGFIYKWTNTVNGRWYIGSHEGTIDDGYRHSSQVMTVAEKKHGIKAFVREILFEGDYHKDKIREKEGILLQFYDAANDPLSYNRTNIIGENCHSPESNLKRSKALKGKKKAPFSTEHRKNLSESHQGHNKGKSYEDRYGVKRAQEIRQKARDKMKGRTFTDEHSQKLSAARRAYLESQR